MDECIALAKEIAKNSFVIVKVSKNADKQGNGYGSRDRT